MLTLIRAIARATSWLLLMVIVSCSLPRQQPVVNALADNDNCRLDSIQVRTLFSYMQHFPNGSEASIALLVGDSTSFIGVSRQNDSVSCVENRTGVFEIGSITKTVTATMLAKLVYDGVVDLEAPIKDFLPITLRQSSRNGKEVTLLQLANHTSGIPKEPANVSTDWARPGSPYSSYDEVRLYDYLSNRMILQSTPGEQREYSNLGGGLLGHLLTRITGKPYEDLLRDLVCEPLGLRNTFVTLDSGRMQHLVAGRDPAGKIVPNWELNVLAGGGGIKSTAEDMAKYLRAHMTDTTYCLLTQQPTIKYTEHNAAGLGWAWYINGSKHYVSATGGTGGYSCCVIFERSTETGIVLLTNVSAFLASKGEYIVKLSRALYDPLAASRESAATLRVN
ncbi:beta-lactamase family protein [candidate division KSB1 bacterium]|nr:beta-lactamase family protein [bacterium]NUM68462.1 beta-lactamase family protein [candidate division KSB1 bacterium]